MTGPVPSPFAADAAIAERIAALAPTVGAVLGERLAALADAPAGGRPADLLGDRGVVTRDEGARLVQELGLRGVEELMLLAIPFAARLARPPISGYVVGAVGLEAGSGDLLLGGNVEFPGTSLGLTLHGEGAVALRAFARGTALEALAISSARPCAHCRQVLTEFSWSDGLRLLDPHGHRLALAELYPWPFAPRDLGTPGVVPGATPWPGLGLGRAGTVPEPVARLLVAAGRRAHAPYSGAPAAAVLELPGGRLVAGSSLESVAFNPSIGPVQAAIPEVLARGHELADIRAAWVAAPVEAAVDHPGVAGQLLAAVAPAAPVHVVHWA